MTKTLLLMILLLTTGIFMQAQDAGHQSITAPRKAPAFGVKGGSSYSNPKLVPNYAGGKATYEPRVGMYAGLVVRKPLSRRWAFQPELVYASQGHHWRFEWQHDSNGDTVTKVLEGTEKHGYIHLPLLFQYTTKQGLILYGGPQPGFLVVNRDYRIKNGDLAWVAGAAYRLKGHLGVEARYNAGLINIAGGIDLPHYAKAKNRVAQVGVVYYFDRVSDVW